jgi:hypothetical protein
MIAAAWARRPGRGGLGADRRSNDHAQSLCSTGRQGENSMAEAVADSAIRKATRRLLPFLLLLYFINYIDRINIGFAALTMNKALGLTASQFGIGASIFFVGYVVLEVPSNLSLRAFGRPKPGVVAKA